MARIKILYLANAPEDGKATCLGRMDREIAIVLKRYPDAL